MLEKLPLDMIPNEDKMDYLRCHKKIKKIINDLKSFKPCDNKDQKILRKTLKDYEYTFKKIETYNKKANHII